MKEPLITKAVFQPQAIPPFCCSVLDPLHYNGDF